MPEVRVIDVVGWDEMWPFWGPEAIRADLQIGETGRLVLCNLTLESLKQGGPFIIARIGRWAPSASSNRDFGKARYVAGCPNSVDVAPESPFMQVTHISIDSPADAVTQYKELEAEIEAWPERSIRCRWGNTGWYIEYSKTLFRPEFVQ